MDEILEFVLIDFDFVAEIPDHTCSSRRRPLQAVGRELHRTRKMPSKVNALPADRAGP